MAQHEKPRKRFEAKHAVAIIISSAVIGVGALALLLSLNQGEDQSSQGDAQIPAGTRSLDQDNSPLQVGNCLVITGSANDTQEEKVDCSDKSKFSFEVSQVVSDTKSCPDNTASYEISGKSRSGSTRTVEGRLPDPEPAPGCLLQHLVQRHQTLRGGGVRLGQGQGHQTRRTGERVLRNRRKRPHLHHTSPHLLHRDPPVIHGA